MDTLDESRVPQTDGLVEWSAVLAPIPGEPISGDGYLVLSQPARTLLVAIDGLGHGPEAVRATDMAKKAVVANSQLSVSDLFTQCDKTLKPTRGAAITIASIEKKSSTLIWAGIGNVEALLMSGNAGKETLILRNGIVGLRSQPVRCAELSLKAGDVLFMVSDGIKYGFLEGIDLNANVFEIARSVLSLHSRKTDDAMVVVAKFLGLSR